MKNLKKVSKKLMTLLMLVLSIVMSSPNVFAITQGDANTVNKDGTAAIKISGIEETRKDYVTISAYRLMDTNIKMTAKDDDGNITAWQPQQPVYTWVEEVANWLKTYDNKKYASFVDEDNNNAVTSVFTPCDSDKNDTDKCLTSVEAKTFYDELAKAIKNESIKINPTKIYSKNGANGTTKWKEEENGDTTIIEGLDMGNYLILIENGVNIYSPSAINVEPKKVDNKWVASDAKLRVKHTTPTIDKQVESANTAAGEIGKTVNFKITADVPQYPDNALAKTVIIRDKFSKGLTFNASSLQVLTTENGTPLTQGEHYTLATGKNACVTEPNENGENVETCYDFIITFNNDQYKNIKDFDNIYVKYTGTINGDAVVTDGNTNTATLRYNNNPYDTNSYINGDDDTTTVYTYGLKITKVNEDDEDELLPGAKFEIYSQEKDGNAIRFVPVKNEKGEVIPGVYRKAADDETEGVVTELEVGPDGATNKGVLEVRGLALGTYYAEETEAPEGYVKLQNRVKIELADKLKDEKNTPIDGILDNDTDGFKKDTIKNNDHIFVLPVTGGIGTLLFSVIGIMFMGLGAFLIKNIFKKEDAE